VRAVVTDASALVEYILGAGEAPAIAAVIQADDTDLHCPALCDVEVAAALRRALLAKTLSSSRAADAMEDYFDLPLTRHGHQRLVLRALQLRADFSTYDAVYVALAEQLDAHLLTADDRLAAATRRHLGLDLLP
jgi:predicted nucleic acid-binding protein